MIKWGWWKKGQWVYSYFSEPVFHYTAVACRYLAIQFHDDVIKWKHLPRYWPFVWGIHRSPVISPHKGQWRGALMFLWSAPWINGWVNNREAGDLRQNCAHCDVTVMSSWFCTQHWSDSWMHGGLNQRAGYRVYAVMISMKIDGVMITTSTCNLHHILS